MRSRFLLPALVALSSCQFIPGTDASKIAEAEKAVRGLLVDPDSAQFRDAKVVAGRPDRTVYRGSKVQPELEVVCGQVNSRNRMGGYGGYSVFSHEVGGSRTIVAPEEGRAIDLDQRCSKG